MSAGTQGLSTNRSAIDDFLQAAAASSSRWTEPSAPGKWSPSQVLEHVARSLEESAKDMQGQRSKFPQLPGLLRLLARQFLFKRVLKSGTFPKARTNRAMDPESGPRSVEEGRRRLEGAWQAFVAASKQVGPTARSRTFGDVDLGDYLRFQALHTSHHRRQLPGS